jgi:hypothetical protein
MNGFPEDGHFKSSLHQQKSSSSPMVKKERRMAIQMIAQMTSWRMSAFKMNS